MICAIGPFATDMHLASMPTMARDLGAADATIQLNMMTYFVGFTIGQLFYGPISDRSGRKPVIFFALGIFVLASTGLVFATDALQLLALRFLQGIGGSIGMVIATASIRDLYTGHAAARLMSIVVLVLGLAPIIAPLAGSLVLTISGWRTIFGVLCCLGLLCALAIAFMLPETRMPELRAQSHPLSALKWYVRLPFSGHYIPYAGTLALSQGGFFAYIAGSSFVLINVYGLTPFVYSLVFAANAVSIGIGTQIGPLIGRKIGVRTMVKLASLVYALAALLLVGLELAGLGSIYTVCGLLFVMVMGLGAIMPSCNILAMESYGAIAGTAAALMGALGFGAGAIGSAMIGIFEDGTALPLLAVIAAFAVAASLVAHLGFPREVAHHKVEASA
jgi:DHA1 family bicyclomycin/chloramphenicol resistance-like MFS transporter